MTDIPTILLTTFATCILTVAFLYLYYKEKQKFLLYLFFSWATNVLRYFSIIIAVIYPNYFLFSFLSNFFTLISSMLLLKAVYLLLNRHIKSYWYAVFGFSLVWLVLVQFNIGFRLGSLPIYFFTGIVFIFLGYRIYKADSMPKSGRKILSFIFIFWGLHKIDFPFLKNDPYFAEYGFSLATFLSIAAALGFIVLYFDKAKAEIVESESKLKSIFENHSLIFFFIDSNNGNIIYANKSAISFYGYSYSELTNMNINQINLLSAEVVKDSIRKVEIGEKNFFEFKHRLKNGTIKDVIVYTSINHFSDRKIVFSIVVDQTEKKKVEKALIESEIKFRSLVENIPGTVYRCELNYPWRPVFVSKNIEQLCGYKSEEFTTENGRTLGDIVHKDDLNNVCKAVDAALSLRRSYNIEYRLVHKNGRYKWVFEKGRAFFDNDSNPLYLDGVFLDISERKALEDSLLESESKFRLAFETIPDAMAILTIQDDIIRTVNSGFISLTAYKFNELTGARIKELKLFREKYYNTFKEILLRDGLTNDYEIEMIAKNGFIKTLMLSAVIISIKDEMHFICIAHDITLLKNYQIEIQELNSKLEEKVIQRTAQLNETLDKLQNEIDNRIRVQEELEDSNYELKELNDSMITHSRKLIELNERLSDSETELLELNRELENRVIERTHEIALTNEKLEKANQIKGIILNNLGHELRTPLNGAMGFLSILQTDIHSKEQKDMINMSYNSMKRLERTLNSLLFLTELESGKIKINIAEVSLPQYVKFYFSSLFSMFEKNNVEFIIQINDNRISALIDEQLLYQVFYNVFDNAVKYTKQGTITIECGSEIRNGKETALIKIIDTGSGIKEENIPKVFEAFRQESEGIARISEGLGLGLSISKKMLENMNGEIEINSQLNIGTCVSIYLPTENKL